MVLGTRRLGTKHEDTCGLSCIATITAFGGEFLQREPKRGRRHKFGFTMRANTELPSPSPGSAAFGGCFLEKRLRGVFSQNHSLTLGINWFFTDAAGIWGGSPRGENGSSPQSGMHAQRFCCCSCSMQNLPLFSVDNNKVSKSSDGISYDQ